jgi:hypothetical protein
MPARRHTRQTLQAEADRWVEILKAKGFKLPRSPITVYTSGIQFEAVLEGPPHAGGLLDGPFSGYAARSKDGLPIVLVRLPRSHRRSNDDPLVTLIHELLHHVSPELDHEDVYALSKEFRADDKDSMFPPPPPVSDLALDDMKEPQRELSDAERRDMEAQGLEWLDTLWLDANGFPSNLPPRSAFTGRFMKALRIRGPQSLSNTTRSLLVRGSRMNPRQREKMG